MCIYIFFVCDSGDTDKLVFIRRREKSNGFSSLSIEIDVENISLRFAKQTKKKTRFYYNVPITYQIVQLFFKFYFV